MKYPPKKTGGIFTKKKDLWGKKAQHNRRLDLFLSKS